MPVDSEKNSLNISPEEVKKHLTEKTAGIYVVHTYGIPADIERIDSIAKEKDLFLIEDIAHSLLSEYKGRLLGEWADFTIVSLTKQMINSGGGAIGIKDKKIYEEVLEKRNDYYSKELFSFIKTIVYKILRFVSSVWESRTNLVCLFTAKFIDSIVIFFFGSEKADDDVRPSFYKICPAESWFACLELERLRHRRKFNEAGYQLFIKKFNNIMLPNAKGISNISYWGGMLSSSNKSKYQYILLKIFSFRTWKNYYEPGKYPQADKLFNSFKIFSRIVRYF